MTTATGSRRAARTAQTRAALIDAALELMSRHGFDAVSTDEIAATAGVAPRTFFRYFATKESVLLFGEDDFISAFADRYPEQPPTRPELAAVTDTFVALARDLAPLHRRIRLYHRALASSHVLRGQEQLHLEQNAGRVAAALARRRGLRRPDARCQLLANISIITLQTAVHDWAEGPARAALGDVIRDRFSLLARIVSEG